MTSRGPHGNGSFGCSPQGLCSSVDPEVSGDAGEPAATLSLWPIDGSAENLERAALLEMPSPHTFEGERG